MYIKLWAFTVDIGTQVRQQGRQNFKEEMRPSWLAFQSMCHMLTLTSHVHCHDRAGQSNYITYNTGYGEKNSLSNWVASDPANFILMEVRATNIGESKFCLRPFASVEVASIIETVNEGSTVKLVAKTAIELLQIQLTSHLWK